MQSMSRLPLVLILTACVTNSSVFASESTGSWRASFHSIELSKLGTYVSGGFAVGAAEIVTYDSKTRRAFVVNAGAVSVDVLDVSNPASPTKVGAIDAASLGGSANSVAVHGGVLAVAIEAVNKQDDGLVAFYRTHTLQFLGSVTVGALPDMLTFTPDGRFVLVANEGEPNDAYTVDPEGSVSIIDLRRGVAKATVRHATFERFNNQADGLRAKGVRIYGPNASVAQDFEPEYITVAGNRAYVTLQESNAIAVIDIQRAKVVEILPLGYKDHSQYGNQLDPSDRDGGIVIGNWPVRGMYEPDAIASYRHKGQTYLVTANEGDTRDYDGFAEEVRVGAGSVKLDATVFPNGAALKANASLGRLTITNALGDADADGDYDALYVPGARSFSIWTTKGVQVFDSGSDFEAITANLFPDTFNSNHEEQPSRDTRSDNKGPEPEGLALGEVLGRTFAFVGLERMSGIMVYDITDPSAAFFVQYIDNRNFAVPPCVADAAGACTIANPAAGDLGPEGLHFVPWYRSPTLKPLLLVGNEISGTTTVYEVGVTHR
jgi:DNA-binding beta-propeller fold protein YncE